MTLSTSHKTVLIYALVLAVAAFGLQWLEHRLALRWISTETYVVLIAVCFTGLGAWLALRLAPRAPSDPFSRNQAALRQLKISAREFETLELLAAGHSNKEIARVLGISPNTVKTHLAHLYEKLAVSRRTQAIGRAKALGLLP